MEVSLACHPAQWSEERMRLEADSFLLGFPEGLQYRQSLAIVKAMAGDNSQLEKIRQARDRYPSISKNVRTREVTDCFRLYEPIDTTDRLLPLLVYLHGGGWTIGSVNSCGRYCDAMAASGKMKVLAVNYRLAPEYPYPCGLVDCVEAVKYAVDNADGLGIDPSRISVGGDSSGGNLAIATAMTDECNGLIESLILFYPVTKAFPDSSESWLKYGEGYGLDSNLMQRFNEAYRSHLSLRESLIDVGVAEIDKIERIPRSLMIAAGRDILRDQGMEFVSRFSDDRISRIEFDGAVHLFITLPGQEEAFRTAVKLSTDFLTKKR